MGTTTNSHGRSQRGRLRVLPGGLAAATGAGCSRGTTMVHLLQKIWYSDGSIRLQTFEASTLDAAMRLAYEALDREIADQWEEGRIRVVKALCDERDLVELVA
jgi:hypothetical protein